MTLETTLANLEATNAQLVSEVVQVKTISIAAQDAALAARDRAETAASTTEQTKVLMMERYADFVAIDEAVAASAAYLDDAKTIYNGIEAVNQAVIDSAASATTAGEHRDATGADRIYIDEQVVHVDAQRSHIDTQKGIVDDNTAKVAADLEATTAHRNAADAAQLASETARDESQAWASAEGVVATINLIDYYSARVEAQRALAEREAAEQARNTADQRASDAADSQAAAKQSETNSAASEQRTFLLTNEEEDVEVEPGVYSAKHYLAKAKDTMTGALVYKGVWDASTGVFPADPKLGEFWKVSVLGEIASKAYKVGDSIIFNGSTWDHIDNTESVTSVGGFLGDVTKAQLLAAIKDVDGSGSGLDAGLLEGKDLATIVAERNTAIAEAIAPKLDAADYTAQDVLTKVKSVAGKGSGLDSDTVRGETPTTIRRKASSDATALIIALG